MAILILMGSRAGLSPNGSIEVRNALPREALMGFAHTTRYDENGHHPSFRYLTPTEGGCEILLRGCLKRLDDD